MSAFRRTAGVGGDAVSRRRAAADCGGAARGCGGGGRRPPPPPYLVMRPATGSSVCRLQPCAGSGNATVQWGV